MMILVMRKVIVLVTRGKKYANKYKPFLKHMAIHRDGSTKTSESRYRDGSMQAQQLYKFSTTQVTLSLYVFIFSSLCNAIVTNF